MGGRDGRCSATGPNGRLVTSLREVVPVRERDSHLDQLADIGFDRLVTGGVGAHVRLGHAVDPDPLVGPVEESTKVLLRVNREPVPVGDGLSVGEQDAGALRGSQDYRPPGGGLVLPLDARTPSWSALSVDSDEGGRPLPGRAAGGRSICRAGSSPSVPLGRWMWS